VVEVLELAETRHPDPALGGRRGGEVDARRLDRRRDQRPAAGVDGLGDPLPSHPHQLRKCDHLAHGGRVPYHAARRSGNEAGRFSLRVDGGHAGYAHDASPGYRTCATAALVAAMEEAHRHGDMEVIQLPPDTSTGGSRRIRR
jgi:hypothetical protein